MPLGIVRLRTIPFPGGNKASCLSPARSCFPRSTKNVFFRVPSSCDLICLSRQYTFDLCSSPSLHESLPNHSHVWLQLRRNLSRPYCHASSSLVGASPRKFTLLAIEVRNLFPVFFSPGSFVCFYLPFWCWFLDNLLNGKSRCDPLNSLPRVESVRHPTKRGLVRGQFALPTSWEWGFLWCPCRWPHTAAAFPRDASGAGEFSIRR